MFEILKDFFLLMWIIKIMNSPILSLSLSLSLYLQDIDYNDQFQVQNASKNPTFVWSAIWTSLHQNYNLADIRNFFLNENSINHHAEKLN